MEGEHAGTPDFSDLTCTNLMIRLKMLLKKAQPGMPVSCIVRRYQRDTIEVPFSRSVYGVVRWMMDGSRYQVTLTKNVAEPGP